MDALRSGLIDTAYQVAVDLLCHERDHRSCCFTDGYQRSIQSHICIDLILLHSLCPETFTASSYIPVTQIIYKLLQCFCSFRNAVICQVVINCSNGGIQFGQDPAIHNRQRFLI